MENQMDMKHDVFLGFSTRDWISNRIKGEVNMFCGWDSDWLTTDGEINWMNDVMNDLLTDWLTELLSGWLTKPLNIWLVSLLTKLTKLISIKSLQ